MSTQEDKEKAEWRLKKHIELKAELQQNEKFQTFIQGMYPGSRDEFIDRYAAEKVRWLEWGPNFKEWLEKEDLHWTEDATDRLKEIQQKKLFDVQCLWRAEKLQLPEIKVTYDFYTWEGDIFNCPFINPVTPEEVDMYIQYLQSQNFENEQGFLDRWQDYEGIKEAYNEGNASRNFPDWYDFHNSRTGLSVYLLLPDVRGQKEEFYLSLWRAELHAKSEEARKKQKEKPSSSPAAAGAPDTRPHLQDHKDGWLTWFVNTYEDKQTQEMFKRYGGEHPFEDNDEFLEADLELLAKADRIVPVTGWFDWKEAIHRAADSYRRDKIMEALPLAFEQYRMNVDLHIPFPKPDSKHIEMNNWYAKAILRGRELNGEPLDFDF